MRIAFIILVSLFSGACGADVATPPIKVQVLGSGENCAVVGVNMPCQGVSNYLSGTLHAVSDTSIVVEGDNAANSGAVAARVANTLRSAGFKHVVPVGFITVPPDK